MEQKSEQPRPAAHTRLSSSRGPVFFGAILVITFLSRVPFLDAGYGDINDGWRLARAAREIGTTGRYTASRYPPHPVQEWVCSLFWRGGPVPSNTATAILSAVAVLFFALSMSRLGMAGVLEASTALAFAPVIFVNSTNSLDYLWALAFILGSFYFVLDGKAIVAGILLGLAIGSRITSGAMLLPLLILAWRTLQPDRRNAFAAKFAGAAGLAGAAIYVPVFRRYGWSFWTFTDRPIPFLEVLRNGTVGVWGRLGTVAILLSLGWWAFRRISERSVSRAPDDIRRTVFEVSGLAIALYTIAFIRLPHLAAYLIPAVPFVLMILAAVLDRRVLAAVSIAVALSSFVLVGRAGLSAGPIFRDRSDRLAGVNYTKRIVELGLSFRRPTVIIAGKWNLKIDHYLPGGRSGPVRYVYLLDSKGLETYRARGFDLYFLPGQREVNFGRYGFDLLAYGVRPLLPDGSQEQRPAAIGRPGTAAEE